MLLQNNNILKLKETKQALVSLYFIVMFLVSCVGQVEDVKQKTASTVQEKETIINEQIMIVAFPVAHDKIELWFSKSAADKWENTIIYVTYGGLTTPIAFAGENLTYKNYKGLYRALLTGLNINTTYNIKANAVFKNGTKTDYDGTLSVTTFPNVTADFLGITDTKTPAGDAGATSMLVSFTPGIATSEFPFPEYGDPYYYRICVLDTTVLSPKDMWNDAFIGSGITMYQVDKAFDQKLITGLASGVKYAVGIRSVHYGGRTKGDDPVYSFEANNVILFHTTKDNSIGSINFDPSAIELSLAAGSLGRSTVNISLDPNAEGIFNHRRVYFGIASNPNFYTHIVNNADTACIGAETADPDVFCKYLEPNTITTSVAGLDSLTNYKFMEVICGNETCSPDKRLYSAAPEISTSPPVVAFNGLISVTGTEDVHNLDRVSLKYLTPNQNTGIVDGLIVQYEVGGQVYYLNHPDPDADPTYVNDSGLSVMPFDLNDDEIIVKGLDITSPGTKNFRVLPYVYDANIDPFDPVQIYYADTMGWTAANVTLYGPTLDEFPGIDTNFINCNNNNISVSWNAPSGGYWAYYIFVLYDSSTGGVFSHQDGLDGLPGYITVNITPDLNNYTAFSVPDGTYEFSVITFFNFDGIEILSHNNVATGSCTFP
jgi:hypothetical protein